MEGLWVWLVEVGGASGFNVEVDEDRTEPALNLL